MHKIIEINFSQFPFWARVKLCWRILRNQTACHLDMYTLPAFEMLPEKADPLAGNSDLPITDISRN